VKTHGLLAREELNESIDHLRMAAAHAADGAAGALAPRVDAAVKSGLRNVVRPGLTKARGAALDSVALFGVALDGSRETKLLARKGTKQLARIGTKRLARKGKKKVQKRETGMTGKRWPMMVGGLLATGAVVGAASALMRRRRSEGAWDEYGSTRTSGDADAMLDSAKSSMDAGVDKASPAAGAAKERTSDLIGER
jgi:hypothetical protein